jgi:thiamine-monophosphate kinase
MGERRIVRDLLAPRYAARAPGFGDDCATVPLRSIAMGQFVMTTDPCPPPMAEHLGFVDPFYRGWLLATINLSDLAAAGAEPLGLLTSLQLPGSTTVWEFERLLDGIDACCAAQGTMVLGGNLKEAAQLDVSATAVGVCDTPALSRSGARPGDLIVALGDLGAFWAGVLGLQHGFVASDPAEPLLRNVLTPSPKIKVAIAARRAGLLTACMDNSDGLYASLRQLGVANSTCMIVEGDGLVFGDDVSRVARQLDADPLRLALGWGDWQLVATCRSECLARLAAAAQHAATGLHVLGHVEEGDGGVDLDAGGSRGALLALDSERFAPESWFMAGLDAYIDILLHGPLQSAR